MDTGSDNLPIGAGWSAAGTQFAEQWKEPGDIFSVLLIIGGDVVKLALTAVAGGSPLTPVAFSFGWVAYAVSAVVAAISDNRLVCAPEVPLQVLNLRSGHSRSNQSWLLARLLKTYDFWMPDKVRCRLRNSSLQPKRRPGNSRHRSGGIDEEQNRQDAQAAADLWSTTAAATCTSPVAKRDNNKTNPPTVALCVAVYRWRDDLIPGNPTRDLVWWSGFAVSLVQLGVAAIPLGLHSDYAIFLATAAGTMLSYLSASLPQWRREKWHARGTPKDIALTLGNGAQHVIIVKASTSSRVVALDLEDLAAGRAPDLWSTRIAATILAVLWLALLITCTGIRVHTWYLLGVGSIGMLHNIIVAGAPRWPEALGLPLELVQENNTDNDPAVVVEGGEEEVTNCGAAVFAEPKVMWTLMALEERYEGYGKALVPEFFGGKLLPWEEKWWASTDTEERQQLLRQAREDEKQKQAQK